MQHEVKIPSLGESIVSGIITQWNCSNGDYVKEGDVLYELETDKITSEGAAEVSGTVEILAELDAEVNIGQVVAKIDDAVAAPEETPEAKEVPAETTQDASSEPTPKPDNGKQAPSVERIAAQTGIDPSSVEGTGKAGRVTKGDMLKASESVSDKTTNGAEPEATTEPVSPGPVSKATSAPAPEAVAKPVVASSDRVTRKKMTPIRKKIAERLVSVKNEAAILTTFNEVDMSAVMKLRKEMQEDFVKAHGVKLGFMSFFVKAVVGALKAVPGINAQIDGNEIVTNHFYDIGVAVGTDRGLVVPVIRDCEQLSFAEVEQALVGYANQAKAGKITIEDMQGGVFTISNGGVYGSLLSTPIINPPQSGILGMHTIQERPIAVNGEVQIRPMMYLALSYDHRIVDGKEAVSFLINIKQAIENPSRLLFGI